MNNNNIHNVETLNIDYRPDLAIRLFRPIAHLPWAMLLRSASKSHPDSRFDILVANPMATLVTKGEQTTYRQGDSKIVSRRDPFELLQHYLDSQLPKLSQTDDFPFIGGALGYFGYDLGRHVEEIPSIAINDIDVADMAIGLYEWAVIIDHKLNKAHVVGSNTKDAYKWLTDQHPVTLNPFYLQAAWSSNMTKHSYALKFDRIQDYLLSGDCYQINLAQRFTAPYTGSEFDAYLKLESSNEAPFSAYLRFEESSILSISPERFIQLNGNRIETKPIKGTRPRSAETLIDLANAQDLANTEKDQAENLMIVDLLRNDIGRVAQPGTVTVPKLFDIESFPAVHHLVSTINATLDSGYRATDLLRACFPGGSITGAPKIRAMEIIEELEPNRRNIYCGSIGYISRCGTMDTNITIRTLVTHNHHIYAWAGGGIVADSECHAEYQETLDKLSRILPVL